MITVSLCMIVKNEEDALPRCLESVRDIVDEIVIVDTGSDDRTKEIAAAFTPLIYDFEWIHDFAAARNYSFDKATQEYCMWLDADDILLPDDARKLLQLKEALDPAIDAVTMDYAAVVDNDGTVLDRVRRNRLLKRARQFRWEGVVHEDIPVDEALVLNSDIRVTHRKSRPVTTRNLDIYRYHLSRGMRLNLNHLYHYARELHHHKHYEEAVPVYRQFIAGSQDLDSTISAMQRLADCYHFLGDRQKELETIFETFVHDVPRPESCCRLGYYFLQKEAWHQAIYWYEQAAAYKRPDGSSHGGPSSTWLPHMQLALCYYRLGDYVLSKRHNEVALQFRPNDPGFRQNVKMLEEWLSKSSNQ
ncbi:tetratricopeptide repeat-containing glycosyltransferase family 2 protein [Paenibacillus senegalensis]|uniref:tetratricopeptide repeat-containing glycosyltransferase family 2 protein n=1 Tax=Paenibacillus senegalensis TaxID=1465766 RepID=UPI000289D800|nr:glycosyltransferase family 2 protein [Paenibacillus senegalensis]